MRRELLFVAWMSSGLSACGSGSLEEGDVWISSTGGGKLSVPWHSSECFDGSYCDASAFRLQTTFTAAPDLGQTFRGWSGMCIGADLTCDARLTPYLEDNWLVATFGPAYPVWARPIDYGGEVYRPQQEAHAVLGLGPLGYIGGAAGGPYLEAFDDAGVGQHRLAITPSGNLDTEITSLCAGSSDVPLLAGGVFGTALNLGGIELDLPAPESAAGFVVATSSDLIPLQVWEFRAGGYAGVQGVAFEDGLVVIGDHDGLTSPLELSASGGGVDVFLATKGGDDSWQGLSLGSSGRDQALGVAIGSGGEVLLVVNFDGAVTTPFGTLPAGQSLLAIDDGEVVAAVALGGAPEGQVIPGAGIVALADGGLAIGLGYEGDASIGAPHQRARVSGLVAVLDRDGPTFVPRWVVHLDSDERALIQSLTVRGDMLYAAGRLHGRLELGGMQVASQTGAGLLVGFDLADGHARWLRRVGGMPGAVVGAGSGDVELWVGAGGVDEMPRNLGPDVPRPAGGFGWNLGPYLLRFEDESNP